MSNSKKIEIMVAFLLLVILFLMVYVIVHDGNNTTQKESSDYVEINTESTELNVEYSAEELSGEWESYNATITLNGTDIVVEGSGVTNSGNTIKITSAGSYYITGTLDDGNIVVEATKNDDVQLVLDNANITCLTTAPINGVKANKITITLAENSVNNIIDGSSYTTFTDAEKQEPDAAIFSKADLVINGSGKLIVSANYLDGIASKDGLKIINSNIEINSEDDGLRGKDYIAISNADIAINSKGDGIKSTNYTDEGLGYIAIKGGSITINAKADGIQAETVLNISSDTNINITTTGEIESDSASSKGLKAGTEITIESGNLVITSTDDAIHSNGIIIINSGNMQLSSGDDGIHADTNIIINGGSIDIAKSYEGIESSYIEINDGTISLVASDDGINICGGNDSSAMGGRLGENSFSNTSDSNRKLVINGGNIKVNATGDGLDANGSMYINGGTIVVAGPISSGNGPLDYDGECVVTGGNLVVYGSTGMWQNPSNNSTQYSLTYQSSGNAGDEIVIKDSSGNELMSFTTEKSYGGIVVSNPEIKNGETYTMYKNGSEVGSIEVTSIVNTYGSMSSEMNGGMMQQRNDEQNGKRMRTNTQNFNIE